MGQLLTSCAPKPLLTPCAIAHNIRTDRCDGLRLVLRPVGDAFGHASHVTLTSQAPMRPRLKAHTPSLAKVTKADPLLGSYVLGLSWTTLGWGHGCQRFCFLRAEDASAASAKWPPQWEHGITSNVNAMLQNLAQEVCEDGARLP